MKFLLDTDVLIDFLRNREYSYKLIPNLVDKGSLFISVMTIAELRAGFTKEQAEYFLPRLYDLVTTLDLDKKVAELGGKLRFEHGKAITDSLIAATAILGKCQLVTRNHKDFPMPEIRIYPLKEAA